VNGHNRRGYKWFLRGFDLASPPHLIVTMDASVSARKTPDASITCLVGSCHCGAVSYEIPLPPSIDLEHPGVSELYKTNMVAPSKQRFTTIGGKPTQNKWRASHCHCGACRHTVGALMVDWVNILSKDIIITRKGPTRKYRSSTHASREFVSVLILRILTSTHTVTWLFPVSNMRDVSVLLGRRRPGNCRCDGGLHYNTQRI
jgi:hypothetical protein